ncbi:hypothetical protein [Nonomuraea sp. NPDC046570]|uniref:hypothetical protein n=1 Tax=Nonomuraea sp. NPDC046570 TaxID=3155255 RepID=UPI003402EBE2
MALRTVFIALGAAALQSGTWAFLLFGAILIVTAWKILKDALRGKQQEVDISSMRSIRLLRRFMPVTGDYCEERVPLRAGLDRRSDHVITEARTSILRRLLQFAQQVTDPGRAGGQVGERAAAETGAASNLRRGGRGRRRGRAATDE